MNFVVFESGSRAGLSAELFFEDWIKKSNTNHTLFLSDLDKDFQRITERNPRVKRIHDNEAFDLLKENDFIKNKKAQSSDKIKIQDAAFLCVKAAGIKGGLFLRMRKDPRYALRELKAMNIVPNDTDPAAFVNGKEFINILSECDSKKGGF